MKMAKRTLACILSVLLMLGIAAIGVSAESTTADAVEKHFPALSETDNGAAYWWVGTNLTVELYGDSGFSLNSVDGTIYGANIGWGFTYEQLKKTPYLNITIGNQERVSETPYMKLYCLVGNTVVTVKPFEDKFLEHWVKAGSVRGSHSVNLLEAVDKAAPGTADDTLLVFFLYHDPQVGVQADPLPALLVDTLFLSSEQIQATTTTTTTTTTKPDETTTTTADTNDVNGNEETNGNSDSDNTGMIVAIVVAAVVIIGGIAMALIIIKKKK